MSYNFAIGSIYTFNTLAPGILQATVKNAKLTSILDYETAKMYINADLMFRQIYPALPAGTPDHPESCVYYRFTSESGEKIVLADQWVDTTTVENVKNINFQVTVTNGSLADITNVKNMMNALGFTNYSIKQI